jgi:hypothetical protein
MTKGRNRGGEEGGGGQVRVGTCCTFNDGVCECELEA